MEGLWFVGIITLIMAVGLAIIEFWQILLVLAGLILIYCLFFKKKVMAIYDIRSSKKVAKSLNKSDLSFANSVLQFLKGCESLVNEHKDMFHHDCIIEYHSQVSGGSYYSLSMEIYDALKNFYTYFNDVMKIPFLDAEDYHANPSALIDRLDEEKLRDKFGGVLDFKRGEFEKGNIKLYTWVVKPSEIHSIAYLIYLKNRGEAELKTALFEIPKKNRQVMFVKF